MLRTSQRLFAPVLLAVALLSANVASAGILEVQFTGLNLVYDGTNIYDAGGSNTTGSGNPAQADALTSMNFFLDGNLVGVLNSDIYADVYIQDVLNIPVGGGVVVSNGNGNGFGVDLLVSSLTPGWGLALNIDTMQFFYTGSKIAISVSGLASELFAQSLPFDLVFDATQPITIVMSSANLTHVTDNGTYLTGFRAAGTGNIAGTGSDHIIPEPGSVALASFGLAALALQVVRRRRRA